MDLAWCVSAQILLSVCLCSPILFLAELRQSHLKEKLTISEGHPAIQKRKCKVLRKNTISEACQSQFRVSHFKCTELKIIQNYTHVSSRIGETVLTKLEDIGCLASSARVRLEQQCPTVAITFLKDSSAATIQAMHRHGQWLCLKETVSSLKGNPTHLIALRDMRALTFASSRLLPEVLWSEKAGARNSSLV